MKLGFVSAIFAQLNFEEVLKFASEEGFDCVETLCWPPGPPDRKHGGVTHIDVVDFSQARADDTRGLCEKYGVEISALGYYSVPLSADKEQAEQAVAHLYKVIDAAKMLGLKNVNSFVGANQNFSLDENFELFEKVWPPLIRHAEEQGIKIGIENCPMLYKNTWPFGLNMARTPAIWRRMFEIIPSENFGLNYDPSHLRMQLMDPIEPIREFGPRIFHAHAKDMRIDEHKLNDVGSLVCPMDRATAKLPGFGDINWGRFIGMLADAGFDGSVCIEVEDEAFETTLEKRKQSLRISGSVLRPLIG